MWMLVLVVGLGGIAAAVVAWYVQWRRAKRIEHARKWREHQEWLEHSGQDSR